MKLRTIAAAALALGALAAPGIAHADLVAAYDDPGPAGGLDIKLIDPVTGASLPAPAIARSTNADEFHPSLGGTNGRFLVWERSTPVGAITSGQPHSTRIMLADRFSGRAVVLGPLPAPEGNHIAPAISPDGKYVALAQRQNPITNMTGITLVNVARFPDGPYPSSSHVQVIGSNYQSFATAIGAYADGRRPWSFTSLSPTGSDSRLDSFYNFAWPTDGWLGVPSTPGVVLNHPAISQTPGRPDFTYHVFDRGPLYGPADLQIMQAGSLHPYPASVNTPADERMPAIAQDGRWTAFVRSSGGRRRIFVYDPQTGHIVNPNGVDIGADSDTQPLDRFRKLRGNLALSLVTPGFPS